MLKTNTKKVLDRMKNHLLDFYGINADLKRDGDAVGGVNDYQKGVNLALGGCFLVYHSEVTEFLKVILKESEAEASKYDSFKSWDLYCHLCGRAYASIVKGL